MQQNIFLSAVLNSKSIPTRGMQEKDPIYKIPSYVSVAHFMHKTRPCLREPMQEWLVCYSDALFPVEETSALYQHCCAVAEGLFYSVTSKCS